MPTMPANLPESVSKIISEYQRVFDMNRRYTEATAACVPDGGWPDGAPDYLTVTAARSGFERMLGLEISKWSQMQPGSVEDRIKVDSYLQLLATVELQWVRGNPLDLGGPPTLGLLVGVESETEAKSAEVRQKRLRVTQKVAAVLCDVTERQVGKWDKGVQRPDSYPGRHDLAVLTAWAETYKQRKLVASAARAANHPRTAEAWMLENLSDDGSGDPAAVLEEHEQNQNRKRKL